MASWCEFHVGFNSGSLVDLVTDKSIAEVFGSSDRDFNDLHEAWVDSGYGFCIPLNFENENEEILFNVGDGVDADDYVNAGSDGEIIVSSEHPNFQHILTSLENLRTKYYDNNQNIIKAEDFKNVTKSEKGWLLTICELEPAKLR